MEVCSKNPCSSTQKLKIMMSRCNGPSRLSDNHLHLNLIEGNIRDQTSMREHEIRNLPLVGRDAAIKSRIRVEYTS